MILGTDDRIAAIVQSRMKSSRLPGKMMLDISGKPLLMRTLERVSKIPDISVVVLATSPAEENKMILDLADQMEVIGFVGDEEDVLDRYYRAAQYVRADCVVRLTGDCPLLDPNVCHTVLERFLMGDLDYASNVSPPTFPDGLDTEIISFNALESIWQEATSMTDREHVTQFIHRYPERFRTANITAPTDMSKLRWTVDESDDLDFVRDVYRGLLKRGCIGLRYQSVLRIMKEDGLRDASSIFRRNEGLEKTQMQEKHGSNP